MGQFNGNPVLNKISDVSGEGTMSYLGVMIKSIILLGIMVTGAAYAYGQGPNLSSGVIAGAAIGGFVIALITIFNPSISPFSSPIYAGLEGITLGALSLLADKEYPGLAMQAVLSTSGVFLVMLFLYSRRSIEVGDRFIKGILAVMVGILIIYLSDLILSLMGITVPVINESSPWGIAFSVGIVIVAALSLAIDFKQIEDAVDNKAPKSMEWYSAFGLMISMVWLYVEVLRLLKKTKD